MADGTLVFDTKIDDKGFNDGVKSLEASGERASNSIGDVMKGILGAEVVKKAASALVDFGKKAISVASDLNEVQNVVDVTFGASAETINNFAKTAMGQFGLTELQAKQYTGTLGAMAKSMGLTEQQAADMSMQLTGLTGDMASFYNLDYETAFEKIRSGISGETEPLKQLGINMSTANLEAYRLTQGIKTQYSKMSELEKVQLRYNYLMEVTSDAQGDFSRTQDGFSNQMRLLQGNVDNLAASLGEKLLPIASGAVTTLNSILSGIGGEKKTVQVAIDIDNDAGKIDELETRLTEINNEYFSQVYKIQVDYTEATNALAEYEKLIQLMEGGNGKDFGDVSKSAASIKAVQEALNELTGSELVIDGVFGTKSQTALKEFQRKMGLAETGVLDFDTQMALLNATQQKSPELYEKTAQALVKMSEGMSKVDFSKIKAGATGDDVERVQAALEALTGMDLSGDNGVWGSASQEALKTFQEMMGLTATGVMDTNTQLALLSQTSKTAKDDVAAIVAIYPELASEVGKDGYWKNEAEAIQKVIDLQRQAALEKALQARQEGLTGVVVDAGATVVEAKKHLKQAESEKGAEEEKLAALQALQDKYEEVNQLVNDSNSRDFFGGINADKLAESQDALQGVHDLVSEFGETAGADELISVLSGAGIDTTKLLNFDGSLKDLSEIDPSNLQALVDAYGAITGDDGGFFNDGGAISESIATAQSNIAQLSEAVTTAQETLAQGQTVLAQAQADLANAATYDELIAELDGVSTEADEVNGTTMSDFGSGLSGSAKTQTDAAIQELDRINKYTLKEKQMTVHINTVGSMPDGSSPGHATGLENVPYDNYYARLHRGEMVLTAAQAREYRDGGKGAAPVVVNVAPAPVSLSIDKRKLAETTAASNSSAIGSYKRRQARGKGL